LKVLVADDNRNNRQLIADILDTMGHETIMAVDGNHTLEIVGQNHPDLIILDVDMPGMNGFDVCNILKSNPETALIPILMLTALSDAENRVRGLVLGADDYLSKPFNPRELIERVKARLRAKSANDELRQTQEVIRLTFERFVPSTVVDRLLQNPMQVRLGGQLQEVTVLFTDLEGFTSISERTQPEKLLHVLNQYHTMVVRTIQDYGGTIDKFIGDCVMALYNTPLAQPDHEERAVRTAIAIRDALEDFYGQFEPEFRMPINIGIHTGTAVVGNIGAPEIMDFTAVGDTVNLAARLQQMASGGQILISQATYQRAGDGFFADAIGSLSVKGRLEEVITYEVLGLER
jgi:adenylate cyclase